MDSNVTVEFERPEKLLVEVVPSPCLFLSPLDLLLRWIRERP